MHPPRPLIDQQPLEELVADTIRVRTPPGSHQSHLHVGEPNERRGPPPPPETVRWTNQADPSHRRPVARQRAPFVIRRDCGDATEPPDSATPKTRRTPPRHTHRHHPPLAPGTSTVRGSSQRMPAHQTAGKAAGRHAPGSEPGSSTRRQRKVGDFPRDTRARRQPTRDGAGRPRQPPRPIEGRSGNKPPTRRQATSDRRPAGHRLADQLASARKHARGHAHPRPDTQDNLPDTPKKPDQTRHPDTPRRPPPPPDRTPEKHPQSTARRIGGKAPALGGARARDPRACPVPVRCAGRRCPAPSCAPTCAELCTPRADRQARHGV